MTSRRFKAGSALAERFFGTAALGGFAVAVEARVMREIPDRKEVVRAKAYRILNSGTERADRVSICRFERWFERSLVLFSIPQFRHVRGTLIAIGSFPEVCGKKLTGIDPLGENQ